MKTPKLNKALFAVSLAMAFAGSSAWLPAHAEIAQTELVQADTITQEAPAADGQMDSDSALQQETIIIKKPKKVAAPKRKVIIQQVEEAVDAEPAAAEAAPQVVAAAPQVVVAQAPVAAASSVAQQAQAQSAGSKIDASINKAVDGVKSKIEDKIVSMLDRIKISVDEDAPAANAGQQVQAAAIAPSAPVQTTIVTDSLSTSAAAPVAGASAGSDKGVYQPLETSASSDVDGASIAKKDDDGELKGRVSIFPLAGITSLSSTNYTIDSRYTAGVGLEIDLGANLSFVGSYSYSQYDVSLNNSYYNNYYMGYYGSANLNKLEYNQNLLDTGIRLYLLPKSSRFRGFIGVGTGFNKGYLNYDQKTLNTFNVNPLYVMNGSLDDYEVTSFVGQVETGGQIQLSKSLAIGASFKYSTVLSSRENHSLNNNGFIMNAYNQAPLTDKTVAGGSIAENSFYSILGNVTLSF